MGIVNHEQPYDDEYSREIIAKARELSSDIDEYVLTQEYLVETPEENLTPLWLRNRLIGKVIEELSDFGITISMDPDDIMDQPLMVDVVLTLRSKFDPERWKKFMLDHTDIRDDVEQLIDDDCISDVIGHCNRVFVVDEGWDSLARICENRPGFLQSNEKFNDVLKESFVACDNIGESPAVPDKEIDRMLEYSKYLSDRKIKIRSLASSIYSITESGAARDNDEVVCQAMGRFEVELSRPSVIRQYLDGELDVKTFVQQKRQFFLTKWKHCLDFWTTTSDESAIPSKLEAAILVATLYVDSPDPDHGQVHVMEIFDGVADLLGERYQRFREIIEPAIGNIAVMSERSGKLLWN
jgi:hypothetical protein